MSKKITKSITLAVLIVVYLTMTVLSQSPSKPAAEPVGVIATNDRVMIDGVAAERGSTVLNGSEIQTATASAFVNITGGGGVLSIAPGSRVKITRETAKLVAELLKGSVTVRSPIASSVVAPDRIVTSRPNNLYTVSVSDSGSKVESFLESVAVQVIGGALTTVAAQSVSASGVSQSQISDKPGPEERNPVTRVTSPNISINCALTGNTLVVSGIVSCRGVAVSGVVVSLTDSITDFLLTRTTTTDEGGRYQFTLTSDRFRAGGIVRVEAAIGLRGCDNAETTCQFGDE